MKNLFRHKKRLARRIMRSGFGFVSLALTLILMSSATLGLATEELIPVAVAATVVSSADPTVPAVDEDPQEGSGTQPDSRDTSS